MEALEPLYIAYAYRKLLVLKQVLNYIQILTIQAISEIPEAIFKNFWKIKWDLSLTK